MGFTIEEVTVYLKIYEGTLMRLCELLGIHLYDQTLDTKISGKAILNDRFIHFLEENKDFFKRYHDDYYKSKNPIDIAATINRKLEDINIYLLKEFPECFNQGIFNEHLSKKLKYVSSYEIDFLLGDLKDVNMNSLGVAAWHLGLKQQMIIDELNMSVHY